MKIYYFLSSLTRPKFQEIVGKIKLLSEGETPETLIDRYYQKMGKYQADAIQEADFLEALSYVKHLQQELSISYAEILIQIEWIYDENFFIFNEELFLQRSTGIEVIEYCQEEVRFVSARDSFQAPFFLILTEIAKSTSNLKIIKLNSRLDRWMYSDKIYYISLLYKDREKYFGDIAFPMFLNPTPRFVREFFSFVSERMGNKLLVKKNFMEMGLGVRALKVDELWDDRLEYFIEKFIPTKPMTFHGIYVLPFMDIKKEYRIYYTMQGKQVKIYSVKNRRNTVTEELFQKSSFSIYKNIPVAWEYMEVAMLGKKELDFIKKICIKCLDKCGVLELFEDSFGKLHFCEVNFLGGSLMFIGQDQENMMKYYVDAFLLHS